MPTIVKNATKGGKDDLYPSNNDNYDGAGNFLRFLYPDLKARVEDWQSQGQFQNIS